MISDCGLCGLSISRMRSPPVAAGATNCFTPLGLAGGAQAPNRPSSRGLISARLVSPTTKIVPLSGRIHRDWNATRSSRVTALTPSGVPEPVKGTP